MNVANLFSFELRVFKTPLIRSVILTLWELEYQLVKHFIHMLITISCSAIIKSPTSKTHSKRICKGYIMKNVSTDFSHRRHALFSPLQRDTTPSSPEPQEGTTASSTRPSKSAPHPYSAHWTRTDTKHTHTYAIMPLTLFFSFAL